MKYKHGMLLGKFCPPHRGHLYLIQKAAEQCEKLTVLVCSIKSEPIPGDLRYYWLSSIFSDDKNINMVHVTDENPQYPHEHPNFWTIWVNTIRENAPDIDAVFSSESYGIELGKYLGIPHVMIDIERKSVPISGTLIRSNPYKYWEYIPQIVRPYFMKKVVLVGPESTGKTFTSEYLANKFDTKWVEEYGRDYLDVKNASIEEQDISTIAAGQLFREQIVSIEAGMHSSLVICDTDLIITQIWSEIYFGSCPEWIVRANQQQKYDLYLLMKPDIPWVDDGTREFPHLRDWHFNRIEKELKQRKLNYYIISGNYEERLNSAESLVHKLIDETVVSA